MKTYRLFVVLIIAGAWFTGVVPQAAQAQTWAGGGITNGLNFNWSAGTNWAGGVAPSSGSAVTFSDGGFPLTTNVQGAVNNIVQSGTTITSLTYNNLAVNNDFVTTLIPSGVTLTLSGSLTVGASDAASQNTVVTMTGGGSLITGTSGTATFSGQNGSAQGNVSVLDLSGLTNFTFNAGASSPGSFNLGTGSSGSAIVVNLAAVSNLIAAATLNIGNNNTRGGGNVLNLGNGTNILYADTINLGVSKTSGAMQFTNNAGGGLTIANHTGTGRANISLGSEGSTGSTTTESVGDMLFNGGTVNILANELIMGNRANRADSPGASGVLTYDSGIVDVTTVNMATNESGGGAPFAMISVGGPGVLKIGSGGMSLVSDGGTAGAGTLIITNGATVICSNDIFKGTSTGTGTVWIADSSLNMASATGTIGANINGAIPIDYFDLTNSTLTLPALGNSSPSVSVVNFNPDGATVSTINIGYLPAITSPTMQFPLISYQQSDGNLGNLVLGTLPGNFTGYLSNNINNLSIDLVITNALIAKADEWGGGINNVWDTTTLNWTNNGLAVNYNDLDFVTFDDNGQQTNVNLIAPRQPGSLNFNNNALNYTFTGAGKIYGSTLQLVMNGSASVTLAETGGDSFAGGIQANAGTLVLDDTNSSISGGLNISGGATVQIGNNDGNGTLPVGTLTDNGTLVFDQTNNVTVSTAIPGNGGLTQNGSGRLALSAANIYIGNTIVNAGTLALTGSGAIADSQQVNISNAVLDVSGVSGSTTLESLNLTNATLTLKLGYLQTNLTVSSLTLGGSGNVINVSTLPPLAYYPVTNALVQCDSAMNGYNFTLGSLPAGSTGFITQSADQTAVLLILTSGPVGTRPSVTWSGVDALNNISTNWSDPLNWQSPGVPTAAEPVFFNDAAEAGGTPFNAVGDGPGGIVSPGFINNIVSTSLTNTALTYANDSSGYQNTLIAPGQILTVNGSVTVNGSGGNTAILGAGGKLKINGSNSSILEVESGSAPTLDLSGLDTLTATIGQIAVGYDIASGGTAVNGVWYLAQTNTITTGSGFTGTGAALVVGSSTSQDVGSSGSIFLGQTNAIFVDGIVLGAGPSINSIITFNPACSNNPVAYIRGITGNSSRVTMWSLGDDTINLNNHVDGYGQTNDFSAGTLDALVDRLVIGQGAQGNEANSQVSGVFNMGTGSLDVTTLQIGASGTGAGGAGIGIMNVTGGTVTAGSLTLAAVVGSGGTATTSGTLNLTNAILVADDGISIGLATGGGTINLSNSTVEVLGGSIGTPAAPLTALNLDGGTFELNVNGGSVITNIVATSVTTNDITTLQINSLSGVTTGINYPLVSYTGNDPYGSLTLAPLPAGYAGTLVDDTADSLVSLSLTSVPNANLPVITSFSLQSGNVIFNGTNGSAGSTYYLLGTTNLALPITDWTPLATNVFGGGSFSLTNAINANTPQQFYILQVLP